MGADPVVGPLTRLLPEWWRFKGEARMALAAFDEMTGLPDGALNDPNVREAYNSLKTWLDTTPP